MTATINKPKPATKRASKSSGKKNTTGNTRKAGKPVAKAPKMISASDAMSAFEDMSKIDTSSVNIVLDEHTPKDGANAGKLTHKLVLNRGDGKKIRLTESVTRAISDAFEADPTQFLHFIEYARIVPLAQ